MFMSLDLLVDFNFHKASLKKHYVTGVVVANNVVSWAAAKTFPLPFFYFW